MLLKLTSCAETIIERRHVGSLGAVIGRDFSYELLAAAAERPEAELQTALAQLVEAGLAFQRGTPPHAEYQFKHGLVRDAAYESLLKARRKAVHYRLADAFAYRAAQGLEVAPEILAYHHVEAGALEAAARHCFQAGKRNAHRSANAEARLPRVEGGRPSEAGLPRPQG